MNTRGRWRRGACALCTALIALAACAPKEEPLPASSETPVPEHRAIFDEVAESSGLRFRHFTGSTGKFYLPEIMGAGVALFDFDNDGDLDVFFPQGSVLDSGVRAEETKFPPAAGQPPGDRLFRNNLVPEGRLTFTDITAAAGLGATAYSMGAAVGDIDNDGFLDLYVTRFGSNTLYHNLGNGRFEDITRTAGVDDPRWSTSSTFVDYDRDGDLDLLVLNYLNFTVRGNKNCQAATGEADYCTPKAYDPVTATLLRNEGKLRFRDLTVEAGLDRARGPGLGVSASDLNGDGWLDLFVANDGMANLLWINQKDGTFSESALDSGAAYAEDGIAKAGMGVAAGDMDRDGDDDLLVVNLAMEGATLFRNDGRIGFLDVTKSLNLAESTYPFTGFGTDWFDYDNDGDLDLFIANGAVTREESQRGQPYPFNQRNLLIRNEWHGQRFVNATAEGGPAMGLAEVSRGAAFGDIDNDGDVDVVVSNNNGPARLFLNRTVERGGPTAIRLRLQGTSDNRSGLGARVRIERDGTLLMARTMHSDSSYCSASDAAVSVSSEFFTKTKLQCHVDWPSGRSETWTLEAGRPEIVLIQGTGLLTQSSGTGEK